MISQYLLAAASSGYNRYHIFGLNDQGEVTLLRWNGEWHRNNLGKPSGDAKPFAGGLTATSWGRKNRYDVFGVASDGSITQLWWDCKWHWSNLGKPEDHNLAPFTKSTRLTSASWGSNRVDVFGVADDGNITQIWWDGQWHWSNLGKAPEGVSPFTGTIAACSWGEGRYDIFGVGLHDKITQLYWNGAQWIWANLGKSPQEIPSLIAHSVTATSLGENRIDVFVLTSGHTVARLFWDGAWHWSQTPGANPENFFLTQISAASWGKKQIDIFGISHNFHYLQHWWNGEWHWSDLGECDNIGGSGIKHSQPYRISFPEISMLKI